MIEVDATALTRASKLIREKRLECSLNDILVKTAADVMARFPDLNAKFTDAGLVPFDGVSVGIAVATDDGLIVPVLRGVDGMSLDQVGRESRDLIKAARDQNLSGRQLGTASLTLSNLGRYGIAFGTPVLNLEEPVLIFIGAMEDRPVGVNGQIVLRPTTTVSICFDHRVADGLRAALFSQSLGQALATLDGIFTPADEDAHETPLNERQLRAASAGDSLAVELRSRGHHWTVDEPVAIGGGDGGPDPVTLVLGGLLSCMIIALKLTARRRKIVLEKVEGRLEATPSGKIKGARIVLDIWTTEDEAQVQKLLGPAKASCLVHDMLKPELAVAVELSLKRAA
jgi:uncharacterized OsmC-like protein